MLDLVNIWKTYEGQPLLNGVSLRVDAGETVCMLGSSGSGKSTLLRITAGLEELERGQVLWDGEDLAGTPVHARRFGLMFQDYALFPHRSVEQNTAFGLRMQGLPSEEVRRRTQEALEQVRMAGFARRRVTDLSGGEQQRVALARVLAPRPRLLMLDEPLGALDRSLREELVEEIRQVLHATGIPALYVTHDQEEAFAVADRLVLLHAGRIVQQGTPQEVYESPVSAWAARFLGLGNLLEGEMGGQDLAVAHTVLGEFEMACGTEAPAVKGRRRTILLRPNAARPAQEGESLNTFEGRALDVVFQGESFRVLLEGAGGTRLSFQMAQPPALGECRRWCVPPQGVLCLEPEE